MRWSLLLLPVTAALFVACSGGGGTAPGTAIPDFVASPTLSALAAARAVEAREDPELPGDHVDLNAIYDGFFGNPGGNNTGAHVTVDVNYAADGNSNPPAGGPHWGSNACGNDPSAAPLFCGPAPWGLYRQPWDPETLLHNMEHGGLIIWYNTSDEPLLDDLATAVLEHLNNNRLIVMTPYSGMEDEHIAITAWGRIDKFSADEYTRERINEFVDVHERRFNPEGF